MEPTRPQVRVPRRVTSFKGFKDSLCELHWHPDLQRVPAAAGRVAPHAALPLWPCPLPPHQSWAQRLRARHCYIQSMKAGGNLPLAQLNLSGPGALISCQLIGRFPEPTTRPRQAPPGARTAPPPHPTPPHPTPPHPTQPHPTPPHPTPPHPTPPHPTPPHPTPPAFPPPPHTHHNQAGGAVAAFTLLLGTPTAAHERTRACDSGNSAPPEGTSGGAGTPASPRTQRRSGPQCGALSVSEQHTATWARLKQQQLQSQQHEAALAVSRALCRLRAGPVARSSGSGSSGSGGSGGGSHSHGPCRVAGVTYAEAVAGSPQRAAPQRLRHSHSSCGGGGGGASSDGAATGAALAADAALAGGDAGQQHKTRRVSLACWGGAVVHVDGAVLPHAAHPIRTCPRVTSSSWLTLPTPEPAPARAGARSSSGRRAAGGHCGPRGRSRPGGDAGADRGTRG
jgi:hypothetical protein